MRQCAEGPGAMSLARRAPQAAGKPPHGYVAAAGLNPRTAHPHATRAAQAAEAAGLQGRFWDMHDLLFENEDRLEEPYLRRYAERLDLDLHRFDRDIESEEVAAKVRSDFLSGARSGVNGTPTFFVNGERYDGSWALPNSSRTSYPCSRKTRSRRSSLQRAGPHVAHLKSTKSA